MTVINLWRKTHMLACGSSQGLLVTDLWEIDGFSCGNRLQVEINGEWVDTHMEMDWSTGKGVWYLTGTDLKGSALENKRVRVLRDR